MMIEYNKNKPLRCFFGFAGYDSQMMALQRLKDNYPDFAFECAGWGEIDENAIIAHNACFPNEKNKNYGDISKIDWDKVPDFDLFTYSFPCTDVSASGKQAGIAKTNQYKLAGNSIVVSPMYHIFRKLFIDKENEREQLELF